MFENSIQQLFDEQIIQVFRHQLEPYGFVCRTYESPSYWPGRKRINYDFYLSMGEIGKLLMVTEYCDSINEELTFNVFLSLFSRDYWAVSNENTPEPLHPTVHDGLINTWLANLIGKPNLAFTIDQTTEMKDLVTQLDDFFSTTILPYFASKNTVDDLLNEMQQLYTTPTVARMRLLNKLGRRQEARQELQGLIASRHQANFRKMVVSIAQKDGLLP